MMKDIDAQIQKDKRRELLLRRKRAVLVARDDLLEATRLTMPHPDNMDDPRESLYVAAKHHELIADVLMAVERGDEDRVIISAPPRHGKTQLTTKTFPAWYVGRNPKNSVIVATYNEKFSVDLGRAVRNLMRSPMFGQVFPDVCLETGSQASDFMTVEDGGSLAFAGRGGTITGRGGDLLLIDDPLKGREEADSPTIRNKLWNWYLNDLKSRLMTDSGKIIIIQTRWHEDDLIGRLTDPLNSYYEPQEAARWKIINLPALAEDNDALKRPEGTALWPERFGTRHLKDLQRADPRGFSALYQGKPSPDDGDFFKDEHIQTYGRKDMPPKEALRFYVASDHAVSTKQGRDSTVLIPVGVDADDTIWVMPDVWWRQQPTDVVVEAMLNTIEMYQPFWWWAERGHISKSIGPFLRKRMIEERVFCAMDEIVPISDKQTRAQSIQARMALGKVRFPKFASWYPAARDQLLKFPHGAHDDFVDALAYIGLGLNKIVPSRYAGKKKRKEAQIGTIGWVKERSNQERKARVLGANSGGW
jgi:predicted phage terminase large subunit-like protein